VPAIPQRVVDAIAFGSDNIRAYESCGLERRDRGSSSDTNNRSTPRMTTGLIRLVEQEAQAGLRRLAGTRASADVIVPERVLVELARQAPGVPAELNVQIRADNRVLVSFGLVSAGATILEQVDMRRRVISVMLDSAFVALALKFLARSPGVAISGRELSLGFGQLPAVADYAAAWDHVRSITLTTTDGVLRAHVEVFVEDRT